MVKIKICKRNFDPKNVSNPPNSIPWKKQKLMVQVAIITRRLVYKE